MLGVYGGVGRCWRCLKVVGVSMCVEVCRVVWRWERCWRFVKLCGGVEGVWRHLSVVGMYRCVEVCIGMMRCLRFVEVLEMLEVYRGV